jgi:hypothetical protein
VEDPYYPLLCVGEVRTSPLLFLSNFFVPVIVICFLDSDIFLVVPKNDQRVYLLYK